MSTTKTNNVKQKTPLQKHNEILGEARACGCSKTMNPTFCMYQPFLDGWDFTPDVGNGQKRGEIFTPRFIVDRMIADSKILPAKAVYQYEYDGSPEYLRKYISKRVFEPAVGTGNFITTILWHKMEFVNELTKSKKNANRSNRELARYQAYTLVALSSIYFNDIDAGNLQTTKWRILRDSEINTDDNINFWVKEIMDNINAHHHIKVSKEEVFPTIEASIKAAGDNWGTADDDKGVMDVLYKRHTRSEAPVWLKNAWKTVIDANAKIFNGIVQEDTIKGSFIIPGYEHINWTFWQFDNTVKEITAKRVMIPLMLQMNKSRISKTKKELEEIEKRKVYVNQEDSSTLFPADFEEEKFASEGDRKAFAAKTKNLNTLKQDIVKPHNLVKLQEDIVWLRE